MPLFASESKFCEYVPLLIATWAVAPIAKNIPAAKRPANRRDNFIVKLLQSESSLPIVIRL